MGLLILIFFVFFFWFQRVLRCTETLIAHLMGDCHADGALEDETKRTVSVRVCVRYSCVPLSTGSLFY